MSKINRVIPKPRNMWSDSHVFVSHVGNGKKEPVYELNEKTNEVKFKFDENGKRVFRNRYDEIQSMKGATDYQKIIEMNGGDLSVFNDPNGQKEDVDLTGYGTAEEVLNASAKLRSHGYDIAGVKQAYENLLKKLQEAQKVVEQPKVENKKDQPAPQQKQVEGKQENEKK